MSNQDKQMTSRKLLWSSLLITIAVVILNIFLFHEATSLFRIVAGGIGFFTVLYAFMCWTYSLPFIKLKK